MTRFIPIALLALCSCSSSVPSSLLDLDCSESGARSAAREIFDEPVTDLEPIDPATDFPDGPVDCDVLWRGTGEQSGETRYVCCNE